MTTEISQTLPPDATEAGRKVGILVLGMHRTGTSAVTRLLLELGAHMPGSALAANSANPAGYWEPEEVVEIHDAFLTAIKRDWRTVEPLPADVFNSEAATRARHKLEELFSRRSELWRGQWVVKDPRMCRLLPLWHPFFTDGGLGEPRILHVLRSPLATAASLKARDKMKMPESLFLWLRHSLEAEQATRGRDRHFMFFEQLHSGEAVPDHLLHSLGRVLGTPLDRATFDAARAKVLKKKLVHHQFDSSKTRRQLSRYPQVRTAFEGFIALQAGALTEGQELLTSAGQALAEADDQWQALWQRDDLRMHMGSPRFDEEALLERKRLESELKKSWKDIAALKAELDKAETGMAKVMAQNEDFQDQVANARDKIQVALKKVESRSAERDQALLDQKNLRGEVADLTQRMTDLQDRMSRLERELESTTATRDQAVLDEKNLRLEKTSLLQQLADHKQELDQAEQYQQELRDSLTEVRQEKKTNTEAFEKELARAKAYWDESQQELEQAELHRQDLQGQLDYAREHMEVAIAAASAELTRVLNSRSYRLFNPLRRLYARLRRS